MKKFHNLFALTLTLLLLSFSPCQSQSWNQIGNDIDGEAVSDYSGSSVSLSSDGQTMAIGAEYNDGNTGSNNEDRGHVRIYSWSGSSWTQVGNDIDGEAGVDLNDNYSYGDQSGCSVSLSSDGQTVAIGARHNAGPTGNQGLDAGHVRIYTWSGTSWTQVGNDIDGEASGDRSGYSVSLSSDGQTVAIGAPYNDNLSGHVRIYNWNGSSWIQIGNDIDGEAVNDYSGESVSLSSDGNTVAIGAHKNDGNGSLSGHVRIYNWNGSSWIQIGNDIDGEVSWDWSGESVSLSSDGNTVAIGARYNDGNGTYSGHVRIYNWNGSSWIQIGNDIDGEAEDDESGYSVSLSSDGNTVAIGAPFNDGNTGLSDEYWGHVRIYSWSGSSWTQVGNDIDGEEVDWSGYSVSLSSDGQTVAIGAPNNDGNGSGSGHVRVFEFGLASGVNEEDLVNEIQLHPNPSTGIFTVNVPDQTNIQASVFDALGKLVTSSNETGTFNLDLSEVPVGIYTLRLDTESGTVTKKLVRE